MQHLVHDLGLKLQYKNFIAFGLIFLLVIFAGGSTGCSKGKVSASPMFQGSGPLPKGGGRFHVGKPYKILGQWYYPSDAEEYNKVGIASWYGDKFHRRMTSNGEWFDMNTLSAAHPTMKLPSYAQVTNLENGREIIVRVNDRGPFVSDRLIDLSKEAAKELGFYKKGTARVRVVRLSDAVLNDDGRHLAALNETMIRGRGGNIALPAPTRTAYAPVSPPQNTSSQIDGLFVQAASFSSHGNAVRAQEKLSSIASANIQPAIVNGSTYYRVRLGPFNSSNAPEALERVRLAGLSGALIVKN